LLNFKPFFLPLAILAVWWTVSGLELVSRYLVPTPKMVAAAFVELLLSGDLLMHIWQSGQRVLLGFVITSLAAVPLAMGLYFSGRVEQYLRFVLEFMRNTPPLAMVPLVILWFGIGEASKLAVIIMASFFPIFLNALSGLKQVDRRLLEMGDTLELTSREKLYYVLIPGALPSIVTGLRLGFGYSWRALIGAELIAAASGLGYMILDAEELARTDIVYVGIIIIGSLGFLFDFLFIRLIKSRFHYAEEGAPA
jgi:sulfonate transport system permease protein